MKRLKELLLVCLKDSGALGFVKKLLHYAGKYDSMFLIQNIGEISFGRECNFAKGGKQHMLCKLGMLYGLEHEVK